jgi:tetratricopeptide (TPR) repeat protein
MESEMLCRLSVVATNQLQVTDALAYGHRALTAARTSGDAHTLVPALDCLKTAYAYLGEIDSLMPILAELEPLVRLTDDVYRMPWVVQESAFPAIAASRWDEAIARLTQALELNRRSGYTAYEGWFVGHIAWVHRLSGDIDNALTLSRRAVDLTQHDEHAWWSASTHTQLGMALLATGDRDGAIEQLERGRAYVDHDGSEARLMNCLGPLAEATGARSVLAEADQLLDTVRVPEGSAWMLGAEAYLAIARAWLAHGEPARARATVEPLRRAALRTGWGWVADAAAAVIESSDAVAGGGAAAAAEGNAPADSAAAG